MKALKQWLIVLSVLALNVQAETVNYKAEARAFDAENKSSDSALFQNISGWMNKGLLLKKRVNLNQAFDRSPNPEEFKSAKDSFVINYDLFMQDPTYKCRRPSYYNYYSKLLGTQPFSEVDCKMNQKVTLVSEASDGASPITNRTIDPKRIYQIHYLFAGKGKQMMSRWGHAMFRLVLCAPGRPVGPECLNDYSYHIVVSYRANVEDMNLDYAKGMNGDYASQLFLMNMSEVVSEYTKGEFRDIISLPMRMNRAEITNFSEKVLENYWSYKGRYYFLTNNCATEAMNLLRSAYPDNAKMQTANITTPLGLYDYLVKNNITDSSVLNDTKSAIRKGYLFPGVSDKLQKSLNLFADEKDMTFENFAMNLSAAERRDAYEKVINEANDKVSLFANALRLEEQILLSREQLFAKKIGNALFGKEPMPGLKDTILEKKIIAMKNLYAKLASQSHLAKGYGIPLEDEYSEANVDDAKAIMKEITTDMEEIKKIAEKFFPKEVEEMRGAMENRQWLLGQMVIKDL